MTSYSSRHQNFAQITSSYKGLYELTLELMDELDGAREDSTAFAPRSVQRALQKLVDLVIEVAETLTAVYSKSKASMFDLHSLCGTKIYLRHIRAHPEEYCCK